MKTIGRKEIASFPDLGLYDLVVKIDTGAFTSSIHCSEIIKEDSKHVTCVFLDEEHEGYTGEQKTFEIIKEIKVKSSNGITERRCMIESTIELFGESHTILLTLTNRGDMNYPVLLGRRFLMDKFVVDVSKKFQDN